jgi:hypothetical protein
VINKKPGPGMMTGDFKQDLDFTNFENPTSDAFDGAVVRACKMPSIDDVENNLVDTYMKIIYFL